MDGAISGSLCGDSAVEDVGPFVETGGDRPPGAPSISGGPLVRTGIGSPPLFHRRTATWPIGRQKSYGLRVFQFRTSASFQLNRGFRPLVPTE